MTIQLRTTRPKLPPRLCIYGPPKVGKTTFAASAPGAVFLPTEDGLADLDVPVIAGDTGKIQSWGELHEALSVAERGDARTVVLDSITAAQDLCFAEVCRLEGGAPSIAAIPYGKGYPRALPLWLAMLGRLDYLRGQGRAVILVGHAQVEHYADPEGEPYDRHALRLHQQADGKPSLRASTMEWVDVLAFAAQRTYRRKSGEGFNERTLAAAGERVLYTQPSPARAAGSRYPLPPEIPLVWDAFIAAYLGATRPTPQENTEPAVEPATETETTETTEIAQ